MRLFTAIDLPAEMLVRLERLISALRTEALIKWSPIDNLHITTKFIGEWPEGRLDILDDALQSVAPREPFRVRLKELGWFPNERAPRVLWAGVDGGDPLYQLVCETESRLESLGLNKEEREFAPHLTLARIKNRVPLGSLRQKVHEMHSTVIGEFRASSFCLFSSYPGSNSSIYRKLREYKFESAMAAS